jgi:4-amino-4-deoxy-L-arabinose transferase-like glycosyltransferase
LLADPGTGDGHNPVPEDRGLADLSGRRIGRRGHWSNLVLCHFIDGGLSAFMTTQPAMEFHVFRNRPDRVVIALIVAFLVLRLILAAALGFIVDESYTIAISRDLSLSYFDHPPLHYWILRAFMPILGEGHAARLPFILLFSGSSWLLYLLTRQLFSAEAGVWAVLSLNLSIFFTVSPGGWIVPDGPLLFCLLAAALTLARSQFASGADPSPWRTWLLTGFWIGLAGLSKYHAVLFAVGLLLFFTTLPERRDVLLHPAPWLGALLALFIVSPVFIWNEQHGWVSFAYQMSRAAPSDGLHIGNIFANIGGQILYIVPWIFVPLIMATWQALRAARARARSWYCLCLALPTIVIFTVVSLWGYRSLPHWQMPGWLMLYPVLGDYLAGKANTSGRRRWAVTSAALMAGLLFLLVGHSVTGYGRLLFPSLFARNDPSLEAFEWTQLRAELKKRGLLDRKDMFVMAPDWLNAGRIDQALGGKLAVIAFGALNEPKHFAFLYNPNAFVGHDALLIGRDIDTVVLSRVQPYFVSIEELPSLAIGRSGMNEIELRILLAKNLKTPFPIPYATRSK